METDSDRRTMVMLSSEMVVGIRAISYSPPGIAPATSAIGGELGKADVILIIN